MYNVQRILSFNEKKDGVKYMQMLAHVLYSNWLNILHNEFQSYITTFSTEHKRLRIAISGRLHNAVEETNLGATDNKSR